VHGAASREQGGEAQGPTRDVHSAIISRTSFRNKRTPQPTGWVPGDGLACAPPHRQRMARLPDTRRIGNDGSSWNRTSSSRVVGSRLPSMATLRESRCFSVMARPARGSIGRTTKPRAPWACASSSSIGLGVDCPTFFLGAHCSIGLATLRRWRTRLDWCASRWSVFRAAGPMWPPPRMSLPTGLWPPPAWRALVRWTRPLLWRASAFTEGQRVRWQDVRLLSFERPWG